MLVSTFSDDFASIDDGMVSRPSREEHLRRFQSYLDSATITEWDDVTPPILRISADGSLAYSIVNKKVTLHYEDESGETVSESTVFSWIETWEKSHGEWKLTAVASTEQTPPPASPEAGRAAVMAADRAFAVATGERGLDAWMSYMAADAIRLTELGVEAVRGTDEIRKMDASLFADPRLRLAWMPIDGGVFKDGRHGFTTGRYELLRDGSDVVAKGAYVTMWRLDSDGQWRVILDGGAADPSN